ncbi:MAG: PIG-L deacetylase family protein [Eubacteriales bacterium]
MKKRILVLAPHTDDGEFGCGGTIAKFIAEKAEMFYTTFSVCELSVPPYLPKNILETEVKNATEVLGIKKENLKIFHYPVRNFDSCRQQILDDLINLKNAIEPDLLLMPSPHDIHQDHNTIATEGIRAFKQISVLGYELPWNNLTFNTQSFVFLEEEYLNKKIEALKCYQSQKNRVYANENFIHSLAVTRGTQIGVKYAEAFEVIRWIIQ